MSSGSHNFIDLFSGCGGLSLGMEHAGFNLIFASDFDQYACETFRCNHSISPDDVYEGDIRILNEHIGDYAAKFEDVALVCGGPPCQGFSNANRNHRLIDDPRNVLYKEYLKFLKEVRPKFFLIENVRGMAKKIDEIKEDIRTYLGDEYDVDYTILNAKDFGVPQNRVRFILIGNRIGESSKKILHNIVAYSSKCPRFTLDDAIGDLPELKPNTVMNNTRRENEDIGFVSVSYHYKDTEFRRFINGDRSIEVLFNHKNRYNQPRDIEIFRRLPQGANSLDPSIADIMPYKRRNDIFTDKYYRLVPDTVCKTITAHMQQDCNMYIHPTQPRGLSPREAARIQTFPDDFKFHGPMSRWYRQIGNAVPVKLAEAIGKELIQYL